MQKEKDITVIRIKDPFNPFKQEKALMSYAGENLLAIRDREGFTADSDCILAINGKAISKNNWPTTYLSSGNELVIKPEVQGDVVRAVLGAVLIVVGVVLYAYGGQALIGLGSLTWAGLGTSIAVMGGAMFAGGVAGLLFSTKMPELLSTSQESAEISQTYSFSPETTQAQGKVIPKIYGKIKTYGNIISTYTESINNKNYLNVLLSLAMDEIKILRKFFINDQPYENFNGVRIRVRNGLLKQTLISNFDDNKLEYLSAVKITYDSGGYTYTTIGSSFDELEADITFNRGLYHQNPTTGGLDPYTVDVSVYYREQGDEDWLCASIQALTYKYAPVGSEDSLEWSLGIWVNDSAGEKIWFELLRHSSSSVHYEGEADSYEGTPGTWKKLISNERIANTYQEYISIAGAQTAAVKRTFVIGSNLPHGIYEIKIIKRSVDQTDITYSDGMYLTAVREVSYADFTYPRHVLVGIKALASDQLSGSLRFSCLASGSFVRVYNGENWIIRDSNNPAWVAYDVLTQPVFYDSWQPNKNYVIGDIARPTGKLVPDLLNEDCSSLASWSNGDYRMAESEIDPAGQFRLDTNAGSAASNAYCHQYRIIDSPPTKHTIKAKLYLDAIGLKADNDDLWIMYSASTWTFLARIASDGLYICKAGTDYTEVGTDIIKCNASAEEQELCFQIDRSSGDELAKVEVFLNKISQGIYDCNYQPSNPDGELNLYQYGFGTDDRVSHVRDLKIATGLGDIGELGEESKLYQITTGGTSATTEPIWPVVIDDGVVDNEVTWKCTDGTTYNGVIRFDGIAPSRIDEDSFKIWADFCDEMVPDNLSGTEKRFEFNGIFDAQMSMWDATIKVGQMSRAAVVRSGYKIFVIIEKASEAAQLFSSGNIIEDSFEESFLSLKDRAGEIEANFLNEEKDYERDTFTIINNAINHPGNKISLQLMGTTKATRVWRAAQFQLLCNQHLKRIIKFDADIDAIVATVGDVINFSHSVPQWGIGDGRIVSAANNPDGQVILDKPVILEAGIIYVIMVRFNDDTLVSKTVSNLSGTWSTLDLTSTWATLPAQYCPYAVGQSGYETKLFRIISISKTSDLIASIGAIEYNPLIYSSDYSVPVVPDQKYSFPNTIPSVFSVAASEIFLKKPDGTVASNIEVTFVKPIMNSSWWSRIEIWELIKGVFYYKGQTSDVKFIIEDALEGFVHVVYFRSINVLGQKQSFDKCPTYSLYIYGKTLPPEDIVEVWAQASLGGLILTWTPVSDPDLDFYRVKWSSDIAAGSWSNSVEVGQSRTNTVTIPSARNGVYFLKAIDTTKNESVNAISVITSIPGILNWNNQITQEQEPLWAGTLASMVLSGVNLIMASQTDFDEIADFDSLLSFDMLGDYVVGKGSYETPASTLATIQVCRCSVELAFSVEDKTSLWDCIVDLDAVENIDGMDNTGAQITPQIALSQDGSTWASYQNFLSGDYSAKAFKCRLVCESLNLTSYIVLREASFIIDLPDREEAAVDAASATEGDHIAFDLPFLSMPRLGITAQGMLTGDCFEVTDKTISGFDIIFKNSLGEGITKTYDWVAKGY